MSYDNLDDAAAAALYMLSLQGNPRLEAMGALYSAADGIDRTGTVTTHDNQHVGGKLAVPAGSLAALFHNHPALGRDDTERAQFSPDDRQRAQMLNVPSYISAGDRVRKFDPTTGQTSDVLAEFPIDEFRTYLMQKLLNRAPNDPRGLYLNNEFSQEAPTT